MKSSPVLFFQHGRTSYFITQDGRVLSAPTATVPAGSPAGPGAGSECPVVLPLGVGKEIASFNGKGYRRVRLAGKNFKVHRLVAEAFVTSNGPPPSLTANEASEEKEPRPTTAGAHRSLRHQAFPPVTIQNFHQVLHPW